MAPIFLRPALVLGCMLIALVGQSQASVLWSLQDVTFDDQTTARGTFRYDAVSRTVSEWNISVQSAPVLPTSTFLPQYSYRTAVDGGFVGLRPFFAQSNIFSIDFVAFTATVDTPGSGRYLRLFVESNELTESGGQVDLRPGSLMDLPSVDGVLNTSFEVAGSLNFPGPQPANYRNLIRGSLVSIPEAGSIVLMAVGLVGILFRARRPRSRGPTGMFPRSA